MAFATTTKVRMGQVDPAGIVFYPRYFEMMNNAVEDWFAQDLGLDLPSMHIEHHFGIPTVKIEVSFVAPSRVGEDLTITISPRAIGRSSCHVQLVFSCGGTERLRADMTIVCMDLAENKSKAWPDSLRERIEAGLVKD